MRQSYEKIMQEELVKVVTAINTNEKIDTDIETFVNVYKVPTVKSL